MEENESDLYLELTAALAAKNDDLQNEIMDKLLETYDEKENNSKDKIDTKVSKKKKGSTKGKGESPCNYVNKNILLYVVQGTDCTTPLLMVS